MTVTILPAVEAAVEAVAQGRVNVQEAEKALEAAQSERDAISARITALNDVIASIAAKRRSGNGDDDADAGRLALINLDLADLRVMHADAEQAAKPLQVAATSARSSLAAAQQRLDHEWHEDHLRRRISRADELASQLFVTVAEIDGPHKKRRMISTNLWAPPAELATLLRRLDLGARGLS